MNKREPIAKLIKEMLEKHFKIEAKCSFEEPYNFICEFDENTTFQSI